jgi:hypothetical protein
LGILHIIIQKIVKTEGNEAAPMACQPRHRLAENENTYEIQGDRREMEKTIHKILDTLIFCCDEINITKSNLT